MRIPFGFTVVKFLNFKIRSYSNLFLNHFTAELSVLYLMPQWNGIFPLENSKGGINLAFSTTRKSISPVIHFLIDAEF